MQNTEKWYLEFESGLKFAAIFFYLKMENLQAAVSPVRSLV